MTENSLEQQALTHVNSGHYKEAIELYKELWESSEDKKWQQQLAHCYIQRALSFAEREMIREALLHWEKYIYYAQAPFEYYDRYIGWLIQSGDQNKIKLALQQLSAEQLDKQYPEFAVSLGLLMLTEHPEYQRYLPEQSIFIKHFKIAQAAWQAYLDDNQDELNESLKQLPYRSTFKDFRLLLKAAQKFPHSVEQALTKISVTSPYALTINLLHACTLSGSVLLKKKLTQFNYSQRCTITEIKGFDNNQQQFIESFIPHHGGLTDKIKFNLGIQYHSLIGTEFAQHFCQAMLANYPAGESEFNKQFRAASPFESYRIKALANERDGNNERAEYFWRQSVDALPEEGVKNSLKKALILRRMATYHSRSSERIPLLIESLDFDSDDLASYQQILHYFDQEIEEYEKWLKKTIAIFPYNVDVLTQAILIARRNKADKKANQYALDVLTIDPLNIFAKDFLFSNYLAEARQLIQDKNYSLVEEKINNADNLQLGKKHAAQIQLIRGLYSFADQNKRQGLELVVKSLSELNKDPINTYFQGTMEALLTGLPVADILEKSEAPQGYLLSEQQLNRFIQQLKYYSKEFDHQLLLLKAIEKIKPALKTSLTQQDYGEVQLLVLSETLKNINAFELLRHCAKLAIQKWNTPIWQYYQLYSENNGMAEKCSAIDITELKKTREQAANVKDNRTLALIDAFLDEYKHTQSEMGIGIIEDLIGLNQSNEQEVFEDPLEQLFAQIPEDELLELTKKTEALTMSTTPEQLVEGLIKDNHEFILQAMMQQPDLFSALMILKAANSLEISLNISVIDILESFHVTLKA